MPSQAFTDDIRDYALGYLLIDFARVNLQDTGVPVDDEELSAFVEPQAKITLGQRRCEQILAWLARDEALYRRWLMLVQSRQMEGEFAATPAPGTVAPKSVPEPVQASPTRWWQSLFAPRLSFAAAFGVTGAAVLAAYLALAPHQSQPLLVHQGEALPARASQAQVSVPDVTAAPVADQLGNVLRCIDLDAGAAVCYSATREQQHWFVLRSGQVQAVVAPVHASKIATVRAQADTLLIEFSENSYFKLALLHVTWTKDGWHLRELHADAISDGHFDQIQLEANQLQYNRIRPGAVAEPVKYVYADLQ